MKGLNKKTIWRIWKWQHILIGFYGWLTHLKIIHRQNNLMVDSFLKKLEIYDTRMIYIISWKRIIYTNLFLRKTSLKPNWYISYVDSVNRRLIHSFKYEFHPPLYKHGIYYVLTRYHKRQIHLKYNFSKFYLENKLQKQRHILDISFVYVWNINKWIIKIYFLLIYILVNKLVKIILNYFSI